MTTWYNWAQTETAEGIEICTPRDTADLAELLAGAPDRAKIRALGSGHSFTGIGRPVQTGLDLTAPGMRGLRRVDLERDRVTLGAGTRLWEIPDLLAPYGLAMQNLGDINRQTLAGATSTGTHGTGARYGGIATQIVGATLVTAAGEVLCVDEQHRPELLPFIRVGLGALGVLTEVTLQCVPAFLLSAEEGTISLSELDSRWDELFDESDHFEFYWFPGTDRAAYKINTRRPIEAALEARSKAARWLNEELLSNGIYRLICELGRVAPSMVHPLNRVATATMGRNTFTEPSADVFATSRRVRFREMEYAVPRAELQETFAEIRSLVDRWPDPIEFPIEVRCTAADDIALSTGHGRDSGYIAVHRYLRKPCADYFLAVEEIFGRHAGRPHWGKMHTRDAAFFAQTYPRFAEFLAVRDELDPRRRFGNPYLERVLGP